jgi:hypothetical protein
MFTRKRLLKKEKIKRKYRTLILFIGFVLIIVSVFELIYLNFSFGRVTYISPIAKITASRISILEHEMDLRGIKYSSVNIDNDGSFNINLSDSGEVILSSKKDLRSQLSSLQLILSRLTIEGKKLKVLDFRYNHPVVSF